MRRCSFLSGFLDFWLLLFVGISVTTDRRAVYCVDEYLALTPPSVRTWVMVQVTHIIEPNHIFVCFPYGFTTDDDRPGNFSLYTIGLGVLHHKPFVTVATDTA